MKTLLGKDQLEDGDSISWAAYHALMQLPVTHPITINALLPMFYENVHTIAIIKHGMNVIQQATEHPNPGQIPVLEIDQPLFALAKQAQWCWPDIHGEDHYVVMLEGLHTEMAMCQVLGSWLDGSGWTRALLEAGIVTSGTADSFLKASHLTKTCHAHQVTAASLSVL